MPTGKKAAFSRLYLLEIILPSLFAANITAGVLFFLVLPSMESALLQGKRELIRELTASAVSVLAEEDAQARSAKLSMAEARRRAAWQLRSMRYGVENKDYFWIIDLDSRMVMHPYRPDLEGKPLADFADAAGNRPFEDMAAKAAASGEGYSDYLWQWKDDAGRVASKLSYVRLYEPWGWVVGTGVYVTDVEEEIGKVTRRLVMIFVGITGAIVASLALIARRGLALDRQRAAYAEGLKQSRERYKALLESSADGVMLLFDAKIVYANLAVQNMLGRTLEELSSMDLADLFAGQGEGDGLHLGYAYFRDFIDGMDAPGQFQALLAAKDGSAVDAALICSRMTLAGRSNVSVIVRDMRPAMELSRRYDRSARRLEFLSSATGFGILRASATSKGRVVEANEAAALALGHDSPEDLAGLTLDTMLTPPEGTPFVERLLSRGVIHREHFRVSGRDGRKRVLAVRAAVERDERGYPLMLDVILEDVTTQAEASQEQEDTIARLEASLSSMRLPVRGLAWDVPLTPGDAPIREAALAMSRHGGVALVGSSGPEAEGIVTERDILSRAVAAGLDPDSPVSAIMSSPVITLGEEATVAEAIQACAVRKVRHLVVMDRGNAKVVDAASLMLGQRDSLGMLAWLVASAASVEDAVRAQARLPLITRSLVENGAGPVMVTRLFSTSSDTFTRELLRWAEQELGAPPVPYAFLSLGSQGRLEQTLKTDQDNAIVYQDPSPALADEAAAYFAALGDKVCAWLEQAGYPYCPGEVMARNRQWNQPLAGWKRLFSWWVTQAGPEELLNVKIFFDFRAITGEGIAGELREHLAQVMGQGSAPFFNHLAKNCLLARPPLDFFRNISVESEGEHRETFNIKKAMTPLVDMARIYALKNNLSETNTLVRLRRSFEAQAFNAQDHDEARNVFETLMRIRLKHQCRGLAARGRADNHVPLKSLTKLEQELCREAFIQTASLQRKLSLDFTGSI